VLEHLMTRGLKVAGGDRLGKTIVFAKNQQHAEFIAARFDANYPHLTGAFARVVTFKTEYAQSLIDDFANKEKAPHIAISVDMLDTGIDIPEVVNLVFFKLVRSKTKFWQMVGRGTRLCPDLFGPGKDKEFFYLFDYCQNLEYFSQDIPGTEGHVAESLAKRLFDARLELIAALDGRSKEALAEAVKEATATYGDPRRPLRRPHPAPSRRNFVLARLRRLADNSGALRLWGARSQPKRRRPMNGFRAAAVGVLAVALAWAQGVAAQEKDNQAVEAAKQLGFRTRAKTVSVLTDFIYGKDSFSYVNTYNTKEIDRHALLMLTSKPYSDGTSVAAVTTSPTPAGTCDGTFVQVFMIAESCPKLRDTTFQQWKYYMDLGGVALYEDPSSDSLVVALASVPSGCLIVKTGMIFNMP
jgi:hypothetical protein